MSRLKWERKREPEMKPNRTPSPVDFRAAQGFRPWRKKAKRGNTAETLPSRLAEVDDWLEGT